MEFKFILGSEDKKDCFFIREKVFTDEQGFSAEGEFDDIDDKATHLLVTDNDKPIGTARLYQKDGKFYAGRICILKEYRGRNIGALIMDKLAERAKSLGADYLYLSAQVRVSEFYKKSGYEICSEEYLDEFCPHVLMRKAL